MAEAGLLTAPLPPQDGGCGLGTEAGGTAPLLRVLRHIGRGNLSVGRLYEGHVNALMLIYRFGTRAQQERCAAEAHAGMRFAVWNTEGRGGGLRLRGKGDGYQLEGGKTFASGAGHVERPLVTGALPGGGWQMLVVPADEVESVVDQSRWRPVGMRASASHAIDFSGARLSDRFVPRPGQAGFTRAAALCEDVLRRGVPVLPRRCWQTLALPWRRDPHGDHRAAWHLFRRAAAGVTGHAFRFVEYPVWAWELGEAGDFPQRGEVTA